MEELSSILSIIASIIVIFGGPAYVVKQINKNSKNKVSKSNNVIIGDGNNGEKFKK